MAHAAACLSNATTHLLAAAPQDKLEVKLSVTTVYFLSAQDVPQLYHNWGLRYQPAIESNAIAAIKNTERQV